MARWEGNQKKNLIMMFEGGFPKWKQDAKHLSKETKTKVQQKIQKIRLWHKFILEVDLFSKYVNKDRRS